MVWSQLTKLNGVNLTATRLALDARPCSLIGALMPGDILSIWQQAKRAELPMSRLTAEPR